MTARIAVGVSGTGSNLRALVAADRRGVLGGDVALVFADRDCPAIAWAREQGIETVVVRGGSDGSVNESLAAARPDLVVLAGYMRMIGPLTLAAFEGRIVNTHPSLLPAFPGAHAVRDALAAGVRVTGVTIHRVDATLDGGQILAQEAVPVVDRDDEKTLRNRIQAIEHRLLPRTVARLLGAPAPRRALLSVWDKTGLVELARGLVDRGFELVSTGGTARTLREAELDVTDVSAVTGFPEMLDGRVKTLHPRVHAGVLADLRRPAHAAQLETAGMDAFELVVVNLYPFAAAAARTGISLDELIEEIDIGGPTLVRAAAKNHANVAIVTTPARYEAVLDGLADGPLPHGLRAALAVEAFAHTAAYDARIAEELPCRFHRADVALPPEEGLPGSTDPFPPRLTIALEKVETLRYGENPHQPAARYRRAGASPDDGPFASGEPPLQGKALSYNNVLDASAAAGLARHLRGPGAVVVKHTNPCGVAERRTLVEAWRAALAGDPVSAFGGVVALTRAVDAEVARGLSDLFLEVVVAPSFEPDALEILGKKPNLRLLVDPAVASDDPPGQAPWTSGIRSAGGAVLVGVPDTQADDPGDWIGLTTRPPTDNELLDLDLAWRVVRAVTSNAIVIVKDGMEIGLGSGQTSRVDAAIQAVAKARALHGADALRGASAASDAFFPFPDAVEELLGAGVTAIVQPGGSVRDAETLAAVEAAGATMLVTGRRHFRH